MRRLTATLAVAGAFAKGFFWPPPLARDGIKAALDDIDAQERENERRFASE